MCDSGWLARCSERTAQASELAAVNQICVIHEAMNGCKKSKDSLKACFANINILAKSSNRPPTFY